MTPFDEAGPFHRSAALPTEPTRNFPGSAAAVPSVEVGAKPECETKTQPDGEEEPMWFFKLLEDLLPHLNAALVLAALAAISLWLGSHLGRDVSMATVVAATVLCFLVVRGRKKIERFLDRLRLPPALRNRLRSIEVVGEPLPILLTSVAFYLIAFGPDMNIWSVLALPILAAVNSPYRSRLTLAQLNPITAGVLLPLIFTVAFLFWYVVQFSFVAVRYAPKYMATALPFVNAQDRTNLASSVEEDALSAYNNGNYDDAYHLYRLASEMESDSTKYGDLEWAAHTLLIQTGNWRAGYPQPAALATVRRWDGEVLAADTSRVLPYIDLSYITLEFYQRQTDLPSIIGNLKLAIQIMDPRNGDSHHINTIDRFLPYTTYPSYKNLRGGAYCLLSYAYKLEHNAKAQKETILRAALNTHALQVAPWYRSLCVPLYRAASTKH